MELLISSIFIMTVSYASNITNITNITNIPSTAIPTTAIPSTFQPTTAMPTTFQPTTAMPTTLIPTTAIPTTSIPTTVSPTTVSPTTVSPTTVSPTTVSPTTTSSPTQYTTIIGPDINPRQQLLVNFTLNFTSSAQSIIDEMDLSLKLAYATVNISTNYIKNIINFQFMMQSNYYCYIFSMIDAKNSHQATYYQKQIGPDSDDHSRTKFASNLKDILNANYFDISKMIMDVVAVAEESGNSSDSTEIIIWFLGVSALCAIGALILIICWRKFSGKDENENNDNAINLEFLLDPNATMDTNQNLFTSPMHINADDDDDNNNNDDDDNDNDNDDDDDLKPISKKKKKNKRKVFQSII